MSLSLVKNEYSIPVANPAAGAEWLFTNNAAAVLRIREIRYVLTTSAVVATRISQIVKKDVGGNLTGRYPPTSSQLAGQSIGYSAGQALAQIAPVAGAEVQISLPVDLQLTNGMSIGSSTLALQAGDFYSAIVLVVQELLPTDVQAPTTPSTTPSQQVYPYGPGFRSR